jgi:radical SAM superfamily enzyme YgiQ (UPF0313 family)
MTGFEEFANQIRLVTGKCADSMTKTVLGGALASHLPIKATELVDKIFQWEIEDCDIDDIPWPDYEGFRIDKYHELHNIRYMGVLTSRGCPFSCNFCSHTCNFRERDLEEVFKEVIHYKEKYNVELIVFNDNTLNVRKERFLDICAFMEENSIKWSAAIRVDNFDEQMALAASRSGCEYFVVGVESFNQDKLDLMGKRIRVQQIYKTLDLLHKYNIDYHGNIILGYEGDTIITVLKELEELPTRYNILPVLLQPFVGVKAKIGLSPEDRRFLQLTFEDYAKKAGMSMYRSAE